VSGYQKVDEIPYDFVRKRLSILVAKDGKHFMVTKGALPNVLAVCSSAKTSVGTTVDISTVKQEIQQRFGEFSNKGYRMLGIAYRDFDGLAISKDHEAEMAFKKPTAQRCTFWLSKVDKNERKNVILEAIAGD
jgi:Mg2+-importing ATPase